MAEEINKMVTIESDNGGFIKVTREYRVKGISIEFIGGGVYERISNTEAVKLIRERCGMSQTDFAKKFKIPFQTYSQWESGRRNPPTYVVEMMQEIIRQDEFKEPTSNCTMFGAKIARILMELNCPVRIWHTDRLCMVKDSLGQEHYHLSAGEFDVADIQKLRDWLDTSYDAAIDAEVTKQLNAERKGSDKSDMFCILKRLRQLEEKFGEDVSGHHLNNIFPGDS